ncbi:MAG TPA: hypothetical protein VIH48_05295 [Candidatus Bathyarchaeia archaeon]
MAERKQKRESETPVAEAEHGETAFELEPTQIEVGSGYTFSVDYDENNKPIVDIRTYGEVDMAKVRKEIEQLFPNAQIHQLNQTPTVTIVKKHKKARDTEK